MKNESNTTRILLVAIPVASLFMLTISLYPIDIKWVSSISLLPLVYLALTPNFPTHLLGICALVVAGFYYAIGLSWIMYFNPWVYMAITFAQIPVFVIYFLTIHVICIKTTNILQKALEAAAFWIVIQKVYSFTAISTIGSEVPFLVSSNAIQISRHTHFSSFSALILGFQVFLSEWIRKRNKSQLIYSLLSLLCILLLISFFETNKGQSGPKKPETAIRTAIIQHNLPISMAGNILEKETIFKTYEEMVLEAASSPTKPQLIVLPLFELTVDVEQDPSFFVALAQKINAYLLLATYIPKYVTGGLRGEEFKDMAILYSPKGHIYSMYQAIKPPPFAHPGESPSTTYKVMDSPFGKIGVFLCYEDSFSRLAREAVKQGAEFFIAMSNPAQFTGTWLPHYHLIQDQMRAIESNRMLARVSANGHSAFIDASGNILQKTQVSERKIIYGDLYPIQKNTFLHKNPDYAFIFSLIYFLGTFLFRNKQSQA